METPLLLVWNAIFTSCSSSPGTGSIFSSWSKRSLICFLYLRSSRLCFFRRTTLDFVITGGLFSEIFLAGFVKRAWGEELQKESWRRARSLISQKRILASWRKRWHAWKNIILIRTERHFYRNAYRGLVNTHPAACFGFECGEKVRGKDRNSSRKMVSSLLKGPWGMPQQSGQ